MSKCAVIVSRNDNYGDNLIFRAQHTVNKLSQVFDKIFYVDWKSKDSTLTSHLQLPDNVETIKITKEIVNKNWPYAINIPVVETIGRNIGVRRAIDEGFDWICSTNIDILIDEFDENKLDKKTLYTVRRYNVPESFHLSYKDTDSLWNDLIVNTFDQSPLSVLDGVGVWDPGDHWSLVVCCGDFQLAHNYLWQQIRGFEEEMTGRCYADSNLMKRAKLLGYNTDILKLNIYHLNHNNNSYREPEETLPVNDQQVYVANWNKSTNKKDWGTFIL